MHLLKWLYPGMKFKRWLLLFAAGVMLVSLGLALIFNYKYLDAIEEAIFRFVYNWRGSYDYAATALVGTGVVVVGLAIMLMATRFVIRSLIMVLVPENSGRLVDLIYEKRRLESGPAVTVIGGGHGLSVLLRGIKEATSNVTAVVTVADDGGSSGRLRSDLGIIPPGDMRNCLVALADTEPLMEKLFQYRFGGDSELAGHSFGNLFIAAMNEVTGNMETALKESSKVLAVKGRVLPASNEHVRLDALMTDGTVVEGESHIPEAHKQIRRVSLHPRHAAPVQSALDAILNADIILLGPGSLYTSIMPNLLVDGVADALRQSRAIKVYICNVMTQPGETLGYTVSDHLKALVDHVGKGVIDYVLVNNGVPKKDVLKRYEKVQAHPVEIDRKKIQRMGIILIEEDLLGVEKGAVHDTDTLCNEIIRISGLLKTNIAPEVLSGYLGRAK